MHRKRRFWIPRGVAGLVTSLVFAPALAAATPKQINDAVAKGVKYLYSHEKDGNWETTEPNPPGLLGSGDASTASYFGGRTAMATYALLAAGEKPKENPKLDAAVKWLLKADLRGTYAIALRSQVWPLVDQSAARDAARDADLEFLLDTAIQKGPNTGFYGYSYGNFGEKRPTHPTEFGKGSVGPSWWFDRSNSQYGVLGVWALQQAGAEVPQKYWEIVDKAWRSTQEHDGGWSYTIPQLLPAGAGPERTTASPSMGCAGVATLFITQDYLLRLKKWDPCTGATPDINIENGLNYVEKHIQELIGGGDYYAMYGVERIGTASGRRYFDAIDWFEMGADYAIGKQNAVGCWVGKYGPIPDTCFALLFLSRGRAPVLMNKLQYATVEKDRKSNDKAKEIDPWNERPRDVANLAHWASPRIETFFNWQIVNLSARADQLHDAPIVYISGNQELKFSDEDKAKLRTFVEQGGMILGMADCGSMVFARSFQKLGTELFRQYEFRPLPAGHVIFTGEQYRAQKWKVHPRVMGLTNGVRELMLLLPDGDVGRAWQTENTALRPEFFELGANIFLYATDRQNLHYRGEAYVVLPNDAQPSKKRRIARIQTDGNWNPEPGGWTRLAAIFHNKRDTQLDVEPVKLQSGALAGYPIAHLTGTGKITFRDDQRQELKDFVTKGGTLIVDAAGGDAEFANSVELELGKAFGKEAAASLSRPLPMDAPVFFAADKITSVAYRTFASRSTTGGLKAARLSGIPFGNRIGVFYSREDLSGGLVGEPVDGINGYDPASATQLMSNMILYAKEPATAAAAAN